APGRDSHRRPPLRAGLPARRGTLPPEGRVAPRRRGLRHRKPDRAHARGPDAPDGGPHARRQDRAPGGTPARGRGAPLISGTGERLPPQDRRGPGRGSRRSPHRDPDHPDRGAPAVRRRRHRGRGPLPRRGVDVRRSGRQPDRL
ncbi:MAG: hypothetical protein AVDCRST_MAG15-636, partial [uncultured Rubellimicrobium sp.]